MIKTIKRHARAARETIAQHAKAYVDVVRGHVRNSSGTICTLSGSNIATA